jgi:hypothetical protein
VRIIASLLGALMLAVGGFGLAGCNDGNDHSVTNSPGVNPKPVQPTTGTVGSEAPTPPAETRSTTG